MYIRFFSPRSACVVLVLAFVLSAGAVFGASLVEQKGPQGAPEEKSIIPGLPAIGSWMLTRDGLIADWLGAAHQGKRLLEPINVVIIDPYAASAQDAEARLLAACKKAGFPEREGHSSGYQGLIESEVFSQVPLKSEDCFSDAPFELSNDHGRIFGTFEREGSYYFTGAFSRERVDLVIKVKHQFVSFNRARDVFAQRMSERSDYRIESFLSLGNVFIDDPNRTTGDHDGIAVLLMATR